MKYCVTWNAGSSSLKVKVFSWPQKKVVFSVHLDRLGMSATSLGMTDTKRTVVRKKVSKSLPDAITLVMNELEQRGYTSETIRATLHRVVYGGSRKSPVVLDTGVVKKISSTEFRAPLHQANAVQVIRMNLRRYPKARHLACFDTSFFTSLPEHSTRYAVDQTVIDRYDLRRVGYHGLSHAHAVSVATRSFGKNFSGITIHLGSGCSIAAISNGRPIDTSMGYSTLEGLVMGTRSGDIDPGILIELLRRGFTRQQIMTLLERKSGLLGISQYSSDIRDILSASGYRIRGYTPSRRPTLRQQRQSRLALQIFVYRLQKYIGAYCSTLRACQGIVFTGAASVNGDLRRLIMKGLILPRRVKILFVQTDEEQQMIDDAQSLLR